MSYLTVLTHSGDSSGKFDEPAELRRRALRFAEKATA
jgi:hypothetical protein